MSNFTVNDKIDKDLQFTSLVKEYNGKIYRLASKFFKEPVDREDIVQETFIRVYTSLNRLDSNKNVSSWIYRIGTNICIDTLRRRSVRQTATLLPMGDFDPCDLMDRYPSREGTPEEVAINNELRRLIERQLNDLPDKWKAIVYQYYILDMTLEEMSVSNNMPINTVKSRLYRARAYLKRNLIKIIE